MTLAKFELSVEQKAKVNDLYDRFINKKKKQRKALYEDFLKGPLWNNALIQSHFEESTQEPVQPNTVEKKLMRIIKDILIFPELYLDAPADKLEQLYKVIDAHKNFEILFTSHGNRGSKSHGTIAIGCTSLQSGMAISGVGDPTRIKMKLPKEFRFKIIQLLDRPEVLFKDAVQKQFGDKTKIIEGFKTAQYFDSKAINMVLSGCYLASSSSGITQEHITRIGKEFNSLVFKFDWQNKQVHAIHQELWTKPRLSQQHTDTRNFNEFYPIHLAERGKTKHGFFHVITRKIAFRQQPHVLPSNPIRNFLYFEKDKALRDKKRSISYKFKTSEIWTFGGVLGFKSHTSECVGFATRLLGAIPILGSIFNKFSRSGLEILTDSEVEKQQKDLNTFLKIASPTLCFGHLNQSASIRDAKHTAIKKSGEGVGIVFDSNIKKFFSIGLGPVKEHVWGAVITDGNGIMLPKNQWKQGWISKEKTNGSPVEPDVILDMIQTPGIKIKNDPRLDKMGTHVILREPYNAEKFEVPSRPERTSPKMLHHSFQEGASFMLGSHMAEVHKGEIHWNGHQFKAHDYKGGPILIPDATMYGWLEQRRIVKMDVERNPKLVKETVVFGTANDKYPLYPDLLGFMPRRNISKETNNNWGGNAEKHTKYEQRLLKLNPDRNKLFGQQLMFNPLGYAKQFLKNRWDDICEKCGLQIKHAPRKLMINRFITTHDAFILAYLNGSQGIPAGTKLEGNKQSEINIPRPAHVTDHELYRAFAGKHRQEILDKMHFADENLVFDAPSKANQTCYNPIQLLYHRQVGLRQDDDFVSPFKLD